MINSVFDKLNKVKLLKQSVFSIVVKLFSNFYSLRNSIIKSNCKIKRIGFVVNEFFCDDLGGYGGYGKTVKNITSYIHSSSEYLESDVVFAQKVDVKTPCVKRYHDANVYLFPKKSKHYILDTLKFIELVNNKSLDALITIEYYDYYEEILNMFPNIPCIIWIKDPRDLKEWEKIGAVTLELQACKKDSIQELQELSNRDQNSIQQFLRKSRELKRKIIFATQANSLVDIAKREYNLNKIKPFFLPNPITLPHVTEPSFFSKPSFLFLGRLDPIKRPWIYFELAKRFKNVDFFVAGKTHFPELMDPIIQKYKDIPNLKFMGLTKGKDLDYLLNNVWGIVNTSIHEALPVSFLESFAFYKPVISCHNPDLLASRFGIFKGEILGDGFDEQSIDSFSKALTMFLSENYPRVEMGRSAREYVANIHTFKNFQSIISKVLSEKRSWTSEA